MSDQPTREVLAKALDPALWSDDAETAQKAASPFHLWYARQRGLRRAADVLRELRALSATPTPPVAAGEVEAKIIDLLASAVDNAGDEGELRMAQGIQHEVLTALRATRPDPASGAGVNTGWKCNACLTVFTTAIPHRQGSGGDGPNCPKCKAWAQYTFPYRLHEGDPCRHCGVPHDGVPPGPCQTAPADPVSGADHSSDARNMVAPSELAGDVAVNGLQPAPGHADGCGAHDDYACDCPAGDVVEAEREAVDFIIRATGGRCWHEDPGAVEALRLAFREGWKRAHPRAATAPSPDRATIVEARPLSEWHEDVGNVVWWKFPVDEPSWIGTPLDSDWPDYHTHFTPHPAIPAAIRREGMTTKGEG